MSKPKKAPAPLPPLVTKEKGGWGSYEFKSVAKDSGTVIAYEYTIANNGKQAGHFKWKSAVIERLVEAGKDWSQKTTLTTSGVFGVMGRPVPYDHWSAMTRDPSLAVHLADGSVYSVDRCPAYLPRRERWSILARTVPTKALGAVAVVLRIVLSGNSPGLELISEVEEADGEEAYKFKYRVANQSSTRIYVRWGTVHRHDAPNGWPDHAREIMPGAVVPWGDDFVARGPIGILSDVVLWGSEETKMKFPGRNAHELRPLGQETAERNLSAVISTACAPFLAPQALMG